VFNQSMKFQQLACGQMLFNTYAAPQVFRHESAIMENRHLFHCAGNAAGQFKAHFP